jgi:hypothetical protein
LIYCPGADCYPGGGGSYLPLTGGTVTGATTFSLPGSGTPALSVASSGYGAYLYADTMTLHNPLATPYGGLGYDAHLAPLLSVPMGNGSGYLSTTLTAGTNISFSQNTTTPPYTMTINATGTTFTGGTVSGATTFSASGTAMTVDNNAEFQGTVYLSSAGASGTAMLGTVSNTIQFYYASTLLATLGSTGLTLDTLPTSCSGQPSKSVAAIGWVSGTSPGTLTLCP